MKNLCKLFLAVVLAFGGQAFAEILSIEGKPAQWHDIVKVRIRDLHPTQPSVGFDRIYYKLGRFEKDRRKLFDEVCEKNGQVGVRDFTNVSTLSEPNSYSCLQPVGTRRESLKTAVIAPNGELYLTDGHHTFNTYWEMKEGGPDLHVYVLITRDYRTVQTMDVFWEQMQIEQNLWLRDENDQVISPSALPVSFGLKNFKDDSYRSLLFFLRGIAWSAPGQMTVSDPENFDDRHPNIPFVEFYWAREVRKSVNLADYDLMRHSGYMAAINAVGRAVIDTKTIEVGEQNKPAEELGRYKFLNKREILKLDQSSKSKLNYLLAYKTKVRRETHHAVCLNGAVDK